MADIKTRDAVKGTIKTIDKAAIASERMKSAYVGIKEMQEQQKILDDKDKQINSQEEQHKKDLERIAELEAMLKESRESNG